MNEVQANGGIDDLKCQIYKNGLVRDNKYYQER